MGLRINQNIMATNSHRNLSQTQGALSKSLEKLSSGFRINRAGDDAAGEGSGGRLAALNLEYDLSPAGFVRAIVCESGLVTPADVPSFLR